ncbi:MAG: 2,3,4,5-tetrahydropyridine-2,6-dicarboxylate N-succinyltransferase [Rickettsiales bacterium]|nr:MAG: 2,3,4,5-tetrahydropyridine-2,6-dicarboxylate N-succinyltransferase [Rickettsiales bacterium]
MENYSSIIEDIWLNKDKIDLNSDYFNYSKQIIDQVMSLLELGSICVSYKHEDNWLVNEWLKKAILLKFKVSQMKIYNGNCMRWYDKIDLKFSNQDQSAIAQSGIRMVPGAYIRQGTYIGENTIIMPSFINIGAHIGSKTLIDTWATVGSCAYIGKNCHISGGVGIGGVLEPLQARPVIIEDNCFIGARSEVAEGVIVKEGAVISMGVFLGASTKIVDRYSGKITYGTIPPYSVVVPGVLPANEPNLPSVACAVIIKQVDEKTRQKTSINELLREK